MSSKSKTLAKSLHTVSALVAVARYLAECADRSATLDVDAEMFTNRAAAILGYENASDPYQLAARAVAILEAGK